MQGISTKSYFKLGFIYGLLTLWTSSCGLNQDVSNLRNSETISITTYESSQNDDSAFQSPIFGLTDEEISNIIAMGDYTEQDLIDMGINPEEFYDIINEDPDATVDIGGEDPTLEDEVVVEVSPSDDTNPDGSGDESSGGEEVAGDEGSGDESSGGEEVAGDEGSGDESSGGEEVAGDEGSDGEAQDPVDDIISKPTPKEILACAALTGKSIKKIQSIDYNNQSFSSDSVLAFRLTGNRPSVHLNLSASDEGPESIRGLCVFVAGNQGSFSANIDIKLEQLVYIGRGNQSKADLNIKENGSIGYSVIDLSGNKSQFNISGSGSYACDQVRKFGNKSFLNCN